MKKNVHVYCNTHWDFEWYFTEFESTIQLVYHMDEAMDHLEKGTIDHYLLDGQMAIVEDYFKYAPDKKARFQKLVDAGKIFLGPWYTQTDELIVSGESILRNLIYGLKLSRDFTKNPVMIGYLPDSFGQSKDLPKMLNNVGIKQAIFWRGMSNVDTCPVREFVWQCEDGSEVLSYNIKNGYGCDMMVSDNVQALEDKFFHGNNTDLVLLPMGGDQRPIDVGVKERCEFYTKNSPSGSTYKLSHMGAYMDELEKQRDTLPRVKGEFITSQNSKIHRSIYSSRADHKYLNDKVERRMIYQLEPLMVLANAMGLENKTHSLEEIWKTLMRNHAHDSAGGCNSDKTNSVILNRVIETDQLSYSLCDYIVRKLAVSEKNTNLNNLYLFNTLAHKRIVSHKTLIATKATNFKITREDGSEITFDILNQEKTYYGSIKRDVSKQDPKLYYYNTTILFQDELDAMSMKKLLVVELDNAAKLMDIATGNTIEDDFFSITIKDGKVNLTNKTNGETIENWLTLENGGDEGDTYDYSPAYEDKIFKLDFKNATLSTKQGKVCKTITLKGILELPADLEERAKGKTSSKTPYEVVLKLANNDLVDVKFEIDNKTKDHRLRAVFKAGLESTQSIANSQFGLVHRDNTPLHLDDWREIAWREEPTPIYPALNFVALENGAKSCAALLKGIKEYEILNNNSIALTLFRSVGFLGRPDLQRRPGIASGQEFCYIETPDSQLLKKMKAKMAFSFNKKVSYTTTMKTWQDYAISAYSYQDQVMNRYTTALRYFVILPLDKKVEMLNSFIDSANVVDVFVSGIRPTAEKSFIIHLIASDEKAVANAGSLSIKNIASANWCLITGEHLSPATVNSGKIELGSFKTGEMKAIKITLA